MPVTAITYQPNEAQLMAAYRPIRFQVEASGTNNEVTPPFVSCDIYVNDKYYKSVIRTAADQIKEETSLFSFDIGSDVQEALQPNIAAIDNNNVLPAPHMSAKVFCRFRASGIDEDGFTIEEPTKPVQGTQFEEPQSGSGLLSNSFFAINAALQHEDHQNLATHLNGYKQGGWNQDAFPLSHRNRYYICPGDSDHYPVIFRGDCLSTDLVLNYRLKGEVVFRVATAIDINVCAKIDFETSVDLKYVSVDMDSDIADGHYLLVQYKLQGQTEWKDVGIKTTRNFTFRLAHDDVPGNYDIRVIHFCTPCLSATPSTGTFVVEGIEQDTVWRGFGPYCIQRTFDSPIYVELELRNLVTDEEYFPSTEIRYSKTTTTTGELWAKFFSDPEHLNPLNPYTNGLKVYVKQMESRIDNDGVTSSYREVETIQEYTVDADDIEVKLGDVTGAQEIEQYDPYPTTASFNQSTFFYSPYPTHLLAGGNTGEQGYSELRLYNSLFNTPVLGTAPKPNDPDDPDYIVPVASGNCPAGPDQTVVDYGGALEVAKVEFKYNSQSVYAIAVANTGGGGYRYVLPIPKSTSTTLAVKARSLDPGNVSGYVKVRVSYLANGVQQFADFNAVNNQETAIPQTFRNIIAVNISNY